MVPVVLTGVGVTVSAPTLGTRAVTVRVTEGPVAPQKLSAPQMLTAAVVPAGDDENAAGTGTLSTLGLTAVAVTLPNEPNVTTVDAVKLLPESEMLYGAA